MRIIIAFTVCAQVALAGGSALALPVGPQVFCEAYPDSPHCRVSLVQCDMCHDTAPTRNVYGMALEEGLLPGATRPLGEAEYAAALPEVLTVLEAADSDGDGYSNRQEIDLGTFPGDPDSVPASVECPEQPGLNPDYDVCFYDEPYAFRKIYLDFCGHSPTYEQVEELRAMSPGDRKQRLRDALAECLDSEFWMGKDGALWQMAHPKVRPVGSLKRGEDQGALPISDYYDDYNLFVWAQMDGHDVRDVLTADYYVFRNNNPTRYTQVPSLNGQSMQPERRAGLVTTNWVMVYNVMFTAVARTAAAQAYRAFLGFDIAQQEGLFPVPGEPQDYDGKGVAAAECAVCHSTLDPLTYPFRNYNGFQAPGFQYFPNRIETYFMDEGPRMDEIPEAGHILGQPVADLIEWAQVAANSDQFLAATVADYWRMLLGAEPTADDPAYEQLWRSLRDDHGYSIEGMLHDFIETEAYGAP